MKKIGILGGTFDPPHMGHLLIAEYVRDDLHLDEVWFMPTHVPPHKQQSQVEADSRLDMLDLAIHSNPCFKSNDMEIGREGKSYSIDTVKELNNLYPSTAFYFIIGADMVQYLSHWHQIDQLIKRITFVGVKRSGYQLSSVYPFTQVEAPMIDISSSAIRKRANNRQSIKYLVPEQVENYIIKKGLYG